MRKALIAASSLFIVLTCVHPISATAEGERLTEGTLHQFFPDAGLAQAVYDRIVEEEGYVTQCYDREAEEAADGDPDTDFVCTMEHWYVPTSIDVGVVQASELAAFNGSFHAPGYGIKDITGINYIHVGNGRFPTLNLENNEITAIPDGVFDGMTDVYSLGLTGNPITKLQAGVFDGLTGLFRVIIQGNQDEDGNAIGKLETVEPGAFRNMTNLAWVDLSYNQLSSLEPDTFVGMHGSISINLGYNKLTELPAALFADIPELMLSLNVTGNQLTGFPNGLFAAVEAPDLINLQFNNNAIYDISNLPEGMWYPEGTGQKVVRTFYANQPLAGTQTFTPTADQVIIKGYTSGVEAGHPSYDGTSITAVFSDKGEYLEGEIGPIATEDGSLQIESYKVRLVRFPSLAPKEVEVPVGSTISIKPELGALLDGYTAKLSYEVIEGASNISVDANGQVLGMVSGSSAKVRVTLTTLEDPSLLRSVEYVVTVPERTESTASPTPSSTSSTTATPSPSSDLDDIDPADDDTESCIPADEYDEETDTGVPCVTVNTDGDDDDTLAVTGAADSNWAYLGFAVVLIGAGAVALRRR
ncbi:MAG: leucine-rich repeat domain-containing protein [Propionibacteriaceae bacterium]|nr:leucine-rich repeat domain-containing protein [Propionibacteriaceae bacterium]